MNKRLRNYVSVLFGAAAAIWATRNIEYFIDSRGMDKWLDQAISWMIPQSIIQVVGRGTANTAELFSGYWLGLFSGLGLWGGFEIFYAIERRRLRSSPVQRTSTPAPIARSFNLQEREHFLHLLNRRFPEKGSVSLSFDERRSAVFLASISDVFEAAGWIVQRNLTKQETIVRGVRVLGHNSLFVELLAQTLRDCGIVDAYADVQPSDIPPDHVKWPMVQKYARVAFGYEVSPPQG